MFPFRASLQKYEQTQTDILIYLFFFLPKRRHSIIYSVTHCIRPRAAQISTQTFLIILFNNCIVFITWIFKIYLINLIQRGTWNSSKSFIIINHNETNKQTNKPANCYAYYLYSIALGEASRSGTVGWVSAYNAFTILVERAQMPWG